MELHENIFNEHLGYPDTFHKVFNDIEQIEQCRSLYPYLEKRIDFIAIGELLIFFRYYYSVHMEMSAFYRKIVDQKNTITLLECTNIVNEFNMVYNDLLNLSKHVKHLPVSVHHRSRKISHWFKNVFSAASAAADFKEALENPLSPASDERRLRFTLLGQLSIGLSLTLERCVCEFLQLTPFGLDILSLCISELQQHVVGMVDRLI